MRGAMLVAFAALVGCGQQSKPTALAPVAGPTVPGAAPTPGSGAKPGAPTAAEAPVPAKELLTAANDGKLTPAQCTPEFLATLASGTGGAAEFAARQALAELGAQLATESITTEVIGSRAVVGAGPSGKRTAMRLVKGEGGWKVDLLHAFRAPVEVPLTGPAAEAHLVAAVFLDCILSNQPKTAARLMAPEFRKRLAPADDALGYSPGILGIKLRRLADDATGAAITPAASANPASLTGKLTRPGGSAAFELKLVGGLVADFAEK